MSRSSFPILKATGLTFYYDKNQKRIVNNLNFFVEDNEVVGFVGPNGAGKSTTFRMILGELMAKKGHILFKNQDVTSENMVKRTRMGLGYLAQEIILFPGLTVFENLWMFYELRRGLSKKEKINRIEEALAGMRLLELRDREASVLSGGEKRRLEIARLLLMEPSIIILDEPFAGVDPVSILEIQDTISKLKKRGLAVLISDHNVREVCRVVERMYVMMNGEIIAGGTIKELKENEQVCQNYFGKTFEDV